MSAIHSSRARIDLVRVCIYESFFFKDSISFATIGAAYSLEQMLIALRKTSQWNSSICLSFHNHFTSDIKYVKTSLET